MRSIFGWSYPPGCSGPPESPDPHPKSDEMYALLESAGAAPELIDKATKIVDNLAAELERGCQECAKREAEAETKQMAEEAAYWQSQETD